MRSRPKLLYSRVDSKAVGFLLCTSEDEHPVPTVGIKCALRRVQQHGTPVEAVDRWARTRIPCVLCGPKLPSGWPTCVPRPNHPGVARCRGESAVVRPDVVGNEDALRKGARRLSHGGHLQGARVILQVRIGQRPPRNALELVRLLRATLRRRVEGLVGGVQRARPDDRTTLQQLPIVVTERELTTKDRQSSQDEARSASDRGSADDVSPQ